MLRLSLKNYVLHFPFSILLVLQMVMVIFILNVSYIKIYIGTSVINNIEVTGSELYFVSEKSDNENNGQKGKTLEALKGKIANSQIGEMYRNGKKSVDGKEEIDSPAVVYINSTAQKISYKLKVGTWFTAKKNQVIIGGEIAKQYKVGDTIYISEGEDRKIATVIGILKEPFQILDFGNSADNNISNMLFQEKNILLTNSKDLVWGYNCKKRDRTVVLDFSNISEQKKKKLKEDYEIVAVKASINYAKSLEKKYTVGEKVRLLILQGMAFLTVAIQIYLYLRNNKKEIKLYQMLGMGKIDIYGMVLFQHSINIVIAFAFLFFLYQSKSLLAIYGITNYQRMTMENWGITSLFLVIYLVITAMVFFFCIKSGEVSIKE